MFVLITCADLNQEKCSCCPHECIYYCENDFQELFCILCNYEYTDHFYTVFYAISCQYKDIRKLTNECVHGNVTQ